MSKRFSDRILEFIRQPGYSPMRKKRLAHAMGIASAEMGDFHDAVDALRRVGRVVIGTNEGIMLARKPGGVVGTYRGNPRGFGFVVPDESTEHGDLYIPQGDSLDAVTGDKVECTVQSRGKRDGKQAFGGRVVKVLERGNSKFVGTLQLEESRWFIEAEGNTLHGPILIGDPHAKGARAGDQVVVEIVQYPREGSPAKGVIAERLGQYGEPGVDLVSIVKQHHLPDEFPEGVLAETRQKARDFDPDEAAASREDLSDTTIITIDPDTARDFDDAISLEQLEGSAGDKASKGEWHKAKGKHGAAAWELGVHIADVSTFVEPGSELDTEAVSRGTSVYLPGRVIPMLPEILSNGLCSLQEGEPRLCKSAFIRYDGEGRVVATRFANTVIRSAKRLTYGEAQAIVDGEKSPHGKVVVELVRKMNTLAKVIQKRRLKDGMIVLSLPAVDLVMNEEGRVVDAQPEDTSFSHTIIEMFMVEANEAVARLLTSLKAPFLRRIHPPPDEESTTAMARFLRAAGMTLPKKIEPRDLQRVLEELRGKPEGHAVNLAVLKSMQMAEYSPREVGHFALASEDYAHFTSPIRRYPDLMVHRLLELYFEGKLPLGKKRGAQRPEGYLEYDALVEFGRRMSYLSRRAESAERELKLLKVLTLLDQQVGETFEGVVTGVANFGLFVQHPKYLVDGLLRLEDLGDDWWDVDIKLGQVRGERSGKKFGLGSRLTVEIGDVHLPSRQLSLLLVGGRRSERATGRTKSGGGARRAEGAASGDGGAGGGPRGGRGREGAAARGGPGPSASGRGGMAGGRGKKAGEHRKGGARPNKGPKKKRHRR